LTLGLRQLTGEISAKAFAHGPKKKYKQLNRLDAEGLVGLIEFVYRF